MKAAAVALLAAAACAALPSGAAAHGGLAPIRPPAPPPHAAVPGQVIVQFQAGVSASARSTARQAAGARVVKAMQRPGQQLLEVRAGRTAADAIRELDRDPRVVFAQRNYVYTAMAVPNDPQFGQLWGMRNTGQPFHGQPGVAGAPGVDIDAPRAWDRTTGSRKIVVAVVDSGVAFDHPDLDANIWSNDDPANGIDDDHNGFVDDRIGWDFSSGDNDPYDLEGHGTHVAGTIGAEGNNGVGVAGVNWAVSLMPVRVLNANGSGTSQTVADGFDYAGDNGARVVNASLGGPRQTQDLAISDAIAGHPSTLYVVAAGNSGDDNDALPQAPCNLDNANLVCVAATTPTDDLAEFSNFGWTSVDLGAPGTDILSTVPAFVLSEDFEEAGLANWAPTTWTRTNATSSMGSFSMADSAGDYAPGENAVLRTAAAVPNSGGCPLTFDMRMQLHDSGDGLSVDVSTDGTSWTTLGFVSGDYGPDFVTFGGDLPRGADLFIRFRFTADADAAVGDGVYIDDVNVGCVDTAATPDAGDLAFFNGTSMATPHVAGAAALALALRPGTGVPQLERALLSSGDPVPALTGRTVSGRRLNVASLLEAVTAPPPPDGGGGGGGGDPTGGGIPPVGGTIPAAGSDTTTAPPNTLGAVTVTRCRQSGRGRNARLRCRIAHASDVTSASIRLKKGRRTLARQTGWPGGGRLTLRLERKLKKGRYALKIVLRDAARDKRTLTVRFRIR